MAFQIRLIDFKKKYENDIKHGNGFLITDKDGIVNKKRTENGIYSPKYGSTWGDNDAFAERYKCKCGHLMGKLYDGVECPLCGKKVKFVDNNFFMNGWLKLKRYYLIHPQMYQFIEYIIGNRKIMDAMIKFDCPTDIKGKVNKKSKPMYKTGNPKIDLFLGKGMVNFYENFDSILNHFYKIKLKKNSNSFLVEMVYNFIMENREKVFIQYFPIPTLLLRPIIITDEDFRYGKINKKYARLTQKIFILNQSKESGLQIDRKEKRILNNLYYSQTIINDVYDITLDELSKKQGHIRSNVLGNRFNFTARNVIVPCAELKMNEVKLSYHIFLELMKPEVINILSKISNISIYKASEIVENAFINYDNRVYEIMKYIVENKKGKAKILINRNPTLNYGSILAMNVKEVKKDFNDYTLSLPIFILSALAADFDGDVLNVISLKGKKMNGYYDLFNPRTNMVISRNDGLFNNQFNLIKDQLIALHCFSRLGKDIRNIRMYKMID